VFIFVGAFFVFCVLCDFFEKLRVIAFFLYHKKHKESTKITKTNIKVLYINFFTTYFLLAKLEIN